MISRSFTLIAKMAPMPDVAWRSVLIRRGKLTYVPDRLQEETVDSCLDKEEEGADFVLHGNKVCWAAGPRDTEIDYDGGIDDDENGYVDDYYGYDFYNNDSDPYDNGGNCSHATHVAGTIAAKGDNGIGVVGVSWNTKIASIQFLDYDPSWGVQSTCCN